MKHILILALAAVCLMGADLTGTWTGTVTGPSSDGTGQRTFGAHLVLNQQGAKLTGTAGPDASTQHPVQNGKVENGIVSFEVIAGEALMAFELKQEGDEISGNVTREQNGQSQTSTLTAKRNIAKPARSVSPLQELFDTIAALDEALFASYNSCDLEKLASYFSENIEFYHDKGGLANSRKSIVDSVKANICGKVRRELVAGTLEVYPIPGYGAVEAGSHRFYTRQNGGKEQGGGVAKFLHIWQNKDGQWKITRVVSYSH